MPIEPIYRELGARIAERRRGLGLDQERIARRARMSRPLWSKLENGRYRLQLHDLQRVAQALEWSRSSLLCSVDP